MTNCEQVVCWLDDSLDDALDQATARDIQRHLEACESCRSSFESAARLSSEARSLPDEREPDSDLWPGIEARLLPRGPALLQFPGSPRGSLSPTTLAAAAALLVALSASFTGLVLQPVEEKRASRPATESASGVTRAASSTSVATAARFVAAEADYLRASSALMAELEARRSSLPPDALATVEANLKLMDAALAEIRGALAEAPENAGLTRLLTSTHRKKLDVLGRVVRGWSSL